MQHYEVEISPSAIEEIREAFTYIHEHSPQNAQAWLRKLYSRIDTLESMFHRCGLVRENYAFEEDIRELLHYSHRVIYTVNEELALVTVHTIRHAARDEMQEDEF